MWIKLTQNWGEHKNGARVQVDDTQGEQLKSLDMAVDAQAPEISKEMVDIKETIHTEMVGMVSDLAKEMSKEAKNAAKAAATAKGELESEDDKIIAGKQWNSFGHYLNDVREAGRGRVSENLERYVGTVEKNAISGANEATDSEGGFLVPVEHGNQLLDKAFEMSDFLPMTTEMPMRTSSLSINELVDKNHSSGYIYGLDMKWKGEGQQLSGEKPEFGQVQLNLHDLTGLFYATDQLIEDSPQSIEAIANYAFPRAMQWKLESSIFNANGVGQPLGLLNANKQGLTSVISVAKEGSQSADTIELNNITKMYQRMPSANRASAVWVFNNDCFTQLYRLNALVGTTGGVPVWIPGNSLAGAPHGTIFGRPVFFSEHCQTLGDEGDAWFVDFGAILRGVKTGAGSGVITQQSIHIRFDYNETAWKFRTRTDFQPWWRDAITPEFSSETQSPYITLAERA
jgi:HK97 family phage major capsid protein